ncbi:MAG: hypothetical protein ABSG98_03380 [Anaerolineales bacterium]
MNATFPAERKRLGLHYYPDDLHYTSKDLGRWLPELQALDLGWLTLRCSLSRAVPESFLSALRESGIEPILHIPESPIRSLGPELRLLFRCYAGWGVRYLALFSAPNQQDSWRPGQWSRASPVEQFLDVFLPIAELEQEEGLTPLFPPLYPGGDYWDLAFLDAALTSIKRRGKGALLGVMEFAVDAWAFNRPWDWGRGGSQRWPKARPYLSPPGCEDQRGFFGFEWTEEILQRHLGEPRPIVMIRGGSVLHSCIDPNFPPAHPQRHAEINLQIAHQARKGRLPPWLQNVSFWLLAAEEDSPFADQAWFRPDGTTLPVVDSLKGLPGEVPPAPSAPAGKRFEHYLLIPPQAEELAPAAWQSVQDYLRTFRPTCGYSIEEALQAERVTVLGDRTPMDLLERLQIAGCLVEPLRSSDERRDS